MTNAAKGLIIVTGGSRGIGAAICRLLAAAGYPIALNYMSNAGLAEAVVAEITAAGGQAMGIPGDVSVEADVLRLFADAQARLGPLHGLVNNAGILGGGSRVDEMTADAISRVFAVNVVGTLLCAREAVKCLSTRHGGQGGVIVNMSSVAAKIGGAGEIVHYAATKGAVDTLTVGLAREVAGEGIRVNAVAPGLIDTEMNSAERQARFVPVIPVGRVGRSEEVAEAVAWLVSPAASYVTGTTLTVSGGR